MATISAISTSPAMANLAGWAVANFAAVMAAIAGISALAALLAARQTLTATTLTSAWGWALAALLAWSGVELAAGTGLLSDPGWLDPLRLAAIGLTFCPAISLIGAKRPQHAAWNFVVLSLWGIVLLPAAETFFLQRGQAFEMGDARGWFLWLLILLGPINFLPTRFWLGALLLAAGQVLALSAHLPLLRLTRLPEREAIGLMLAAGAMVVAWLAARRKRVAGKPYDRLWLDFRDSFGLLWSLRVQERVNALASQEGWPIELTWSGFCDRTSGAPLQGIEPAVEPILRTSLTGLLRRFVDRAWIAERLAASVD